MHPRTVLVSGPFDDLRSHHVRFLHEASKLGNVHVALWDDELAAKATGRPVKFPLAERQYVIEAMRYVGSMSVAPGAAEADAPSPIAGAVWAVNETEDTPARRRWAADHGMELVAIPDAALQTVPPPPVCPVNPPAARKKVVVTGCYDWLHSGHVRFFEEVSELGDLYVVVGHDRNLRLLKGEGHPLFPEAIRCYMAGSIRLVTMALVSSGEGWLDGEPEFRKLRPDMYAVNEDGDKPEKRKFCADNGIEYRVLKRLPKPGLPRRQSTALRGF
jgi:cytidyltransferase-like protein